MLSGSNTIAPPHVARQESAIEQPGLALPLQGGGWQSPPIIAMPVEALATPANCACANKRPSAMETPSAILRSVMHCRANMSKSYPAVPAAVK